MFWLRIMRWATTSARTSAEGREVFASLHDELHFSWLAYGVLGLTEEAVKLIAESEADRNRERGRARRSPEGS